MADFEGFFMSKKDVVRFRVIETFRQGILSRAEGAEMISLSERQISRLAKKIRENGMIGIKHGNTGRKPVHQKPETLKKRYLDLYQNKYKGFNFKHALELMAEQEMFRDEERVSYETFRQWCRKEHLGKIKKRRTSRSRVARERSAMEGHMLQMDGSHHQWIEGKKTALVGFIDDTTSRIPHAQLYPGETTWACFLAPTAHMKQ